MTTPTPHDRFAQAVFSDPKQAEAVFRAVLPSELTAELDFAQAELLPSLFQDEDLHERRADFLFRVPFAGDAAYLLTLLEHQSSQDKNMAARMLVYAGRAIDRHLRDKPRTDRLPAVIPVVLYHGARGWTAPTELFELYALPGATKEALRGFVPNLRFFLDDLSQAHDDDLRRRPGPVLARLSLIVLRHAQELRTAKDPAETLRSLATSVRDLLQQVRDRTGLIVVFRYMLEIMELRPEEGQAILVQTLPERVKEDVVTAADQLRAQGRAEGELKGMRRVLLRQLHARFQSVSAEIESRIASASEADLEAWTDRVLSAGTIEDVFAS